jgi:hypothetical protein
MQEGIRNYNPQGKRVGMPEVRWTDVNNDIRKLRGDGRGWSRIVEEVTAISEL